MNVIEPNSTYGVSNIGSTKSSSTAGNKDSDVIQQNSADYKEKVENEINIYFAMEGLTPTSDSIYIWDKTYKEGDFNCTKHNGFNGKTTVVKEENISFAKAISNILSEKTPEKIVEEYNKKNELTKKTYYKGDGSYVVTLYNTDGSINKEAVVNNTDNKDSGYKSNIKETIYDKDGSYRVVDTTIEMDDDDSNPVTKSKVTFYDKNGKVDLLSTMLNEVVFSSIEEMILANLKK